MFQSTLVRRCCCTACDQLSRLFSIELFGRIGRFQFWTVFFTWAVATTVPNVSAETWLVENIAGSGVQGFAGDGGLATQAQIDNPFGVVRGPDDAIWFCEYTGQRIRKILPNGTIQTIAGNGSKGYSGDGAPAIQASFNLPHEIRFDAQGDLYVVDMMNHAVRKIQMSTGTISTIAGTGTPGYSGDGGPATQAQLKQPHSIQFGPDGNLYICDIGNHVIRLVDSKTGLITTFAGTGKPGPTPDMSPIRGTPLKGPRSIDFDTHGDLWLATREGNQVFRLDMKQKIIHHIAGTGESGFEGNGGPAKLAKLKGPKGIAIDRDGHVWLADTESHSVRRIHAKTGILELIAGTGAEGDGPEGNAANCRLNRLHGIYVDRDGSILIGDSQAHRVRRLRQKKSEASVQRMALVAGGQKDRTDIPAKNARLYEPFGTAFDRSANLWIIEMAAGNRLLKIDSDGILRHIAGQKEQGFRGDGDIGLSAMFRGPHNLTIGENDRIYIADTWNGRIRVFDPGSGRVSSLAGYEVSMERARGSGPYCATVDFSGRYLYIADLNSIWQIDLKDNTSKRIAGNGKKGVPQDGSSAVDAPLVDPRAVAPDRKGNLYILERGGNALRVVDPSGKMYTVVNSTGAKGNVGDSGPALDARLNGPKHLCVDLLDRVIIADAENHVVLRFDPIDKTTERIAGTRKQGNAGLERSPLECELSRPHGVTVHPKTGEIYITDSYNDRILKIANP